MLLVFSYGRGRRTHRIHPIHPQSEGRTVCRPDNERDAIHFPFMLCLVSGDCAVAKTDMDSSVIAGLLFAAMATTRPIGLHLTLLLTLVFLSAALAARRPWLPLLVPIVCVVVVLQAWSWRNYSHTGVWAVTSNDGITIGFQYPAAVWSAAHKESRRAGEMEMLGRLVVVHRSTSSYMSVPRRIPAMSSFGKVVQCTTSV